MKEIIYLTVNADSVVKMNKSYVGCRKDEIVVKLNVEVEDKAFNPPVLEKSVYINDWKEGCDIDDVRFEANFITEEEAEIIREKRLAKMRSILEGQGYTITEPQDASQ